MLLLVRIDDNEFLSQMLIKSKHSINSTGVMCCCGRKNKSKRDSLKSFYLIPLLLFVLINVNRKNVVNN